MSAKKAIEQLCQLLREAGLKVYWNKKSMKEHGMEIVDATGNTDDSDTFPIEKAPILTHEDACEAAAAVVAIQIKYGISDDDMDEIFQGMLAVYVRTEFCKWLGYEPKTKNQGSKQ